MSGKSCWILSIRLFTSESRRWQRPSDLFMIFSLKSSTPVSFNNCLIAMYPSNGAFSSLFADLSSFEDYLGFSSDFSGFYSSSFLSSDDSSVLSSVLLSFFSTAFWSLFSYDFFSFLSLVFSLDLASTIYSFLGFSAKAYPISFSEALTNILKSSESSLICTCSSSLSLMALVTPNKRRTAIEV